MVIWSRTAERDLRSLVRYISKDGGLSAQAPPPTDAASEGLCVLGGLCARPFGLDFASKDAKGAKEFQNLQRASVSADSSSRSFLNSLGWDPQMTGRFPSASILHICGLIQSSSEPHARRMSRRAIEVGAMMIPISTIRLQRDWELAGEASPLKG